MSASARSRAADLVRREAWTELGGLLCSEDRGERRDAALALLDRGRLRDVVRILAERPDASVEAALLQGEAQVRTQSCSAEALRSLGARVAEEGGAAERYWYSVLVAEHHLWRFDLNAVVTAMLADAPPGGDDLSVLLATRMERISVLGQLLAGDQDAQGRVDALVAEFERVGCREEVSVTETIFQFLVGVVERPHSFRTGDPIEAPVARIEELDSDRAALAWLALGSRAMMGREWGSVRRASVHLRGAERSWPAMADVAVLHELMELIDDEGVTDRVRALVVETLGRLGGGGTVLALTLGSAGLVLLDAGDHELARRVVDAANAEVLALTPVQENWSEEFEARHALLARADAAALVRIDAIIDRWVAHGYARRAASVALRVAADCRRTGLEDDADRLHARAMAMLPPEQDWSAFERQAVERSTAPLQARPVDTIRLFGPDLVVRRAGAEVELGRLPSKLLAVLLISRRRLPVDVVLERLWPDGDPDRARSRLKTLLYRLRKDLQLAGDQLIRRDRTGLWVELPAGWTVDLWDFSDSAASSHAEDLQRAVDLYRGELCSRQHAYDDELLEAHEQVRRTWLRAMQTLVERGAVGRASAQQAAEARDLRL